MAVTNYASKSSSALGTAQDTLAYGSAVAAGSLLFVEIRIGTAATVSSVADSVNAGNWTLLGPTDNTGRQYMAYRENSGAGTPTVTLTLSASGQSPRWAIGEVTNTIGASSFDASDILATGTGTALLANAQSGATATYAHIGLMSCSGATETYAQNGSWTILGVEPAAGTSRLAVVYQQVTSAASRAPAVDNGTSSTWIAFGFMVKQNAASGSPFQNFDQPNPVTKLPNLELRTHLDPSETWLFINKDVQFGGPGLWKSYDWPNPRGYVPGISLRTHTEWYKSELIGKDAFFGGPGAGPDYDYPNPTVKRDDINRRTWLDSYKLQLIGKDLFFSGAGKGPTYDYPNPVLKPQDINQRTHWWNPLINLLNVIVQSPFALLDWPNPLRYRRNPQDFTNPSKVQLVGQDIIYGVPGQAPTYDWPNPTLKKPDLGLRTFVVSIVNTTLAPIIAAGTSIILVGGRLAMRVKGIIYEFLD